MSETVRAQTDRHDVAALVEQRRADIISLAQELVRTPSENPPGSEQAAALVVRRALGALALGGDVTIIEPQPGRSNLCCRVAMPAGPGRTLTLNGHLDTVPAGPRGNWAADPLAGAVVDGRLVGRGSVDMKGALAAMVFAAWAVRECCSDPGTLQILFVADEEGGGTWGADYLMRAGHDFGDAVIVGEPSGIGRPFEYVGTASRGYMRFTLIARGTEMHSSLSYLPHCVNSSLILARSLERMVGELPAELRQASPPDWRYPAGPTLNVGLHLEGGTRGGIIPGLATAYCEVRTLPNSDKNRLEEVVISYVEQLAVSEHARVAVEFDGTESGWGEGTDLAGDDPLAVAAIAACEDVLGRSVPAGGFPGGTDARFFTADAGSPTLAALGPGLLPLAHSFEESLATEDIIHAAHIYAQLACRYFADSGDMPAEESTAARR